MQPTQPYTVTHNIITSAGLVDTNTVHCTKILQATLPGFTAAASHIGFTPFAINWLAILCHMKCCDVWTLGHLVGFIH